jgi:hypothetical protein
VGEIYLYKKRTRLMVESGSSVNNNIKIKTMNESNHTSSKYKTLQIYKMCGR